MGIRFNLPRTLPRLRVINIPPKPIVYSGHWTAGTSTGASPIISGPQLRSFDTNYSNALLYWSDPIGSGKYYFEYNPTSVTNVVAPTNYEMNGFGFVPSVGSTSYATGWEWNAGVGYLYNHGVAPTVTSSPVSWSAGKTMQIAFDTVAHKVWLGINNVYYNGATVTDIANGLKPTFTGVLTTASVLATKSTYGISAKFSATLNNGQVPYVYPVPAGFGPMGSRV